MDDESVEKTIPGAAMDPFVQAELVLGELRILLEMKDIEVDRARQLADELTHLLEQIREKA